MYAKRCVLFGGVRPLRRSRAGPQIRINFPSCRFLVLEITNSQKSIIILHAFAQGTKNIVSKFEKCNVRIESIFLPNKFKKKTKARIWESGPGPANWAPIWDGPQWPGPRPRFWQFFGAVLLCCRHAMYVYFGFQVYHLNIKY